MRSNSSVNFPSCLAFLKKLLLALLRAREILGIVCSAAALSCFLIWREGRDGCSQAVAVEGTKIFEKIHSLKVHVNYNILKYASTMIININKGIGMYKVYSYIWFNLFLNYTQTQKIITSYTIRNLCIISPDLIPRSQLA